MLAHKPHWVVDDATSIRQEVAAWRGTTTAERWRLAELCAKDVMWAIGLHATPQRILDHVDSVPKSTETALQRLRNEAGWGHEPT